MSGVARPGSSCCAKLLVGLAFTRGTLCLAPAIRFTDLGALPAAFGLPVPETASRAGIHLLGLALMRSPPRYARLSPGSRQNADARPQFGTGSGALPPSAPRPPVAFGSSLRPQSRRLPHQVASWTWGLCPPTKTRVGRLSPLAPTCVRLSFLRHPRSDSICCANAVGRYPKANDGVIYRRIEDATGMLQRGRIARDRGQVGRERALKRRW